MRFHFWHGAYLFVLCIDKNDLFFYHVTNISTKNLSFINFYPNPTKEDINISKADYKPKLTLSGSKSVENTNKLTNQSGGDATITDVDPFTTSIKLEQSILDFGRGLELKKSITGLDLAKAKLIKKGT